MFPNIFLIFSLLSSFQVLHLNAEKCNNDEKFEDLEKEIYSLTRQLSTMKDFYENEIQTLRSMLQEQEENAEKIKSRRQLVNNGPVAFYTQISKDIPRLGNNQILMYDVVTTNLGSGYNKIDGIFRAPTAGVYVFNWVTTNRDRSYMNTEIVVNGAVKGKAMSDAMDHADYAVATNVAVLTLRRNDEVWIRTGTWHSGQVAGDMYSTFSGYRIFITEEPDIIG